MPTRVIDPILAVSLVSDPVTTVDAYGDATSVVLDVQGLKDKALVIKNTGTKTLSWKLLGSIDGGAEYDVTVKAEADVLSAAYEYYRFTDYYTHLKVQLKSKLAANPTTVVVKLAGLGV